MNVLHGNWAMEPRGLEVLWWKKSGVGRWGGVVGVRGWGGPRRSYPDASKKCGDCRDHLGNAARWASCSVRPEAPPSETKPTLPHRFSGGVDVGRPRPPVDRALERNNHRKHCGRIR